MGREIFYCHSCGNRILEDDLRKGRALVFLDKVYCQDCKGQAFEQLNAAGGGAAAPAPMAAPVAPAPPPARTGQPGTRPTRIRSGSSSSPELKAANPPSRVRSGGSSPQVQLPREAPAPKSKLPLLIGSIVSFVALASVLAYMMMKDNGSAKATTGPKVSVPVPVDPVYAAVKAYDEFMASKPQPGPEAIIAHIEKIESLIKGSAYAERILRTKKKYQEDLDRQKTSRVFDEAFARVKAQAEADAGTYAKYAEINRELSNLYSQAGMDYPEKLQAVKEAREKYSAPYEAEAQKKFEEVAPVAEQLATKERRYADAVKYIDANFPEKLRQSAAWMRLKTQRDRYARDADEQPQIEPSKTPSTWKEYFDRAQESVQNKDYRGAIEDYLAGMKMLPADLSKLGAQERQAAIIGKYNLACAYFVIGATAAGDAKKKANDSGFEWLNKAGADGVMGLQVPDENNKPMKMADWVAKDSDLDAVRKDPRYDEFMKKYKK